jgi:hypothetical protein
VTRFRAVLKPTDQGAYVDIPAEAVAALGARGRTSVTGSIDGNPIIGQVMPYTFEGEGRKVVLGVTKATRAAIGRTIGDEVDVELERDDRSRSADVKVPPELADALASDDEAAAAFDRLAPSHRREHAQYVAEAKREETRRRRAEKTVARLRGGS